MGAKDVEAMVSALVGRSDIRVEAMIDATHTGLCVRLYLGGKCVPVCPLPPSPYADRECAEAPPVQPSLEDWKESETGDLRLMVQRAVERLMG